MRTEILFFERKMAIPIKSGIVTRYYGELMYIKYDKPYCWLYFIKNNKFLVEFSIQELFDNLPEASFLKCKRSAILNICYLRSFTEDSMMAEMADGTTLNLSKKNVLTIREMIKNLSEISPQCPICYPCTDEKCESQILFCSRMKNRTSREHQKE